VADVPLTKTQTETHTKNLFLRDKKHGLFLVTVSTASAVNTKDSGQKLKLAGKTNLRMADEALLDACLHVKPGTVGPLSIGLCDLLEGGPGKNHARPRPVSAQVPIDSLAPRPQRHVDQIDTCHTSRVFPKGGRRPRAPDTVGKAPANRPKQDEPKPPAVPKKERDKSDKKTARKGDTLLALQWKKEENGRHCLVGNDLVLRYLRLLHSPPVVVQNLGTHSRLVQCSNTGKGSR
jgi:hypothetical protein